MKKTLFSILLAAVMLVSGCSSVQGGSTNGGDAAVTIGDYVVDAAEMQYRYEESITQFYNQNYSYISLMGVDLSGDLSAQMISADKTWRDYFMESSMYAILEQGYLLNEAKANGFELDAKQKADVEKSFSDFYNQVTAAGYDVETYLKENYGSEMTSEAFERIVTNEAMAFYYYQYLISNINVDDAALNSYYEANKKNVDSVDFHIYHFAYTVPETAEGEEPADDSYKTEAKAQADAALAAINTVEEFEPYVRSILSAEDLASWTQDYSFATAKYDEIFTELADWLFDDARVKNDKTVLEYNNGYFVAMFDNRYLDDYKTVDVRHCLIATSTVPTVTVEGTDEIDYEATAANQAASDSEKQTKAEALLNDWVSAGATEADFIKMANENSEDGAVDGLYTKILKGEMVKEFEDWCFDSSRQPGDYGIVKTQYGYHIMYFSAYNELEWKLNAISTVQQTEYEKMYDSFAAKYPVIKNESVLKNIK